MKRNLTFYTNIVSPYQLSLFEELAVNFELKVVYYTKIESDRLWNLDIYNIKYESVILDNNHFARVAQKFMPSMHFSNKIFKTALSAKKGYVIVSGNYFIPNSLIVFIISKYRNQKIYWFGEKLFPTKSLWKKTLKKILLTPMMTSCKAIFGVGTEAINCYKDYGFKGKCYLVPYSINPDEFLPTKLCSDKVGAMTNSLNPAGRYIILTSGSLIERKATDVAINAYKQLPVELRNRSELWILGDGPLRGDLEKMCVEFRQIRFIGFIDPSEVPYYFCQADLFIFCSRYDGWGVVVNEAISAGLPVIVSDKVVASEMIEDGVGGIICQVDDAKLFSKAIELIMGNSELASKMSEHNLTVAKLWSSEVMAKRISAVLI